MPPIVQLKNKKTINMKVEIRPIEKKKWHGKTGTEDFAQPKVIEALIDSTNNVYQTGLSEEETVKYSALLKEDLSSNISLDGKPHPFYGHKKGQLKLANRTLFLDTEKPLEYVKYKMALASPFVANSMRDYESGLTPKATHVIFDEHAEIAKKASKIQLKNKALKISLGMTVAEKADVIQIIRNKRVKGQSQDFIDVLVDDIIGTNPSEFIRIAEMDKAEVHIRATILEGLHKNVLTKEGSAIYHLGDVIGYDYEATVKYFADPNNQKMKITVFEKINIE